MVTDQVFGDVRPEDDYTHPLGPEENFNESMYFNFFDNRLRRGGFLRVGNRANEGYALRLWDGLLRALPELPSLTYKRLVFQERNLLHKSL